MGLGRSGSTLLDILLGNQSGHLSCGELNRYAKTDGIPQNYTETSRQSKFWNKVRERVELTSENPAASFRKYEYHLGWLTNKRSERFSNYLHDVCQIYQSILSNSENTKTIVDSSKYPMRALNLLKQDEFEVGYVYLKRDPVNVVRSFGKKGIEQRSKNWLMANMYYFWASLLCHFVKRALKKKAKLVEVRYEDLVRHPEATLTRISSELDITLDDVIEKVEQDEPLQSGMIFYGNRLRLEDDISVKTEPKSELNTLWEYGSWLINGPLY